MMRQTFVSGGIPKSRVADRNAKGSAGSPGRREKENKNNTEFVKLHDGEQVIPNYQLHYFNNRVLMHLDCKNVLN